jgi:release factor glutamine methyltransferase
VELAVAVVALRAAGGVPAEDEATVIWSTFEESAERDSAVAARAAGTPLEQVVGWAEFGPVRVALAPGVFVPRRRAEAILAPSVAARPDARIVVDLGCGAGALAASLAALLPDAEVHGVELDPAAVACARRTGGFAVHEGSWWSGLPASLAGRVDLAVAYLPHVPTARLDDIHPDFRAHEPTLSVDGGADGLDPLREVLAGLDRWLAPQGVFVTLVVVNQPPEGALVLARDENDVVVAFRRPSAEDEPRPGLTAPRRSSG